MANIGNAPDTTSLEQRVFLYLKRRPGGVKRPTINAHFRKHALVDVDSALRCLLSCKAAFCTDGVWWAK
jgi:hypothetical protein